MKNHTSSILPQQKSCLHPVQCRSKTAHLCDKNRDEVVNAPFSVTILRTNTKCGQKPIARAEFFSIYFNIFPDIAFISDVDDRICL